MAVGNIKSEDYNTLGQYVLDNRGDKSLTRIASDGGINPVRLRRWLVNDLQRIPPADVLNAIAKGLGKPRITVKRVAEEAAGYQHDGVTAPQYTDAMLRIIELLAPLPERWQVYAADNVAILAAALRRDVKRHNAAHGSPADDAADG